MKKGCRCSHCNSNNTIKNGKRKNKNGYRQIILCKSCDKRFTTSGRFSRMRYQPSIIETALTLSLAGLSLAAIKTKLDGEYKLNVPRKTILYWVHKYNGGKSAEARRAVRRYRQS